MARAKPSPYYPPRARWTSPLLGAIDAVRRRVALDHLIPRLAPGVDALELVLAFLLPGLGFYFRLPRLMGRAVLAWVAFLLFLFFLFLGTGWDNLVFGLLLSVHVSGFVFYCTPLLGPSVWHRLLFTLAMLVAIRLLVYSAAEIIMEHAFVTPLHWRGTAIIVGPTKSIRRGDTIAYHIAGSRNFEEGRAYTYDGIDVAPVLALPGEKITFAADTYTVGDVPHPRLPNMPQSGAIVVPQKEWFVWPNVDIQERYYVGESRVGEALLQLALVQENQLIGRPFKRWFWWTQKSS